MENTKRKLVNNASNIEATDSNTPLTAEIVARTATAAGATTGTIAAGARIVDATGVNGQVAYKILLPAITATTVPIIVRNVSAYTFVLASDTAANVYVNGAKGAGYGLSIATAKMAICYPVSTTQWIIKVADYTAAS